MSLSTGTRLGPYEIVSALAMCALIVLSPSRSHPLNCLPAWAT